MNGVSALVNKAPQNPPPHPATWGHRRRLSENPEDGPPDKESASIGDEDRPPGQRVQMSGPTCVHMCSGAQSHFPKVTSLI